MNDALKAKLETLEAERLRVSNEISAYPAPIAGCDAHFTHLLEERVRLSEEISRLQRELIA